MVSMVVGCLIGTYGLSQAIDATWALVDTKMNAFSGYSSPSTLTTSAVVWLVVVVVLCLSFILGYLLNFVTTNKAKYPMPVGTSTEDNNGCGANLNMQHMNKTQCHQCQMSSRDQLQTLVKEILASEGVGVSSISCNNVNVSPTEIPSESVPAGDQLSDEIRGLYDNSEYLEWQLSMNTHILESILDEVHQLRQNDDGGIQNLMVDEYDQRQQKKGVKFQKSRQRLLEVSDVSESDESSDDSDNDCGQNVKNCQLNSVENHNKTKSKNSANTAQVNVQVVADKTVKKDKKKKNKSKGKQTLISSEQKDSIMTANTVEELQDQIKDMRTQLKRQKEEMQKLTSEEKGLTRGELEKKWQEDRYIKRFGPREETPLSPEEQKMDRGSLYKKIVQERRDKWLQYQKDLGISVYQCEICGRYEKEGTEHLCLRSNYKGPLQRRTGVLFNKRMVVEGSGSRFSIRQQPVIDFEKLQKEHAAMTKTLEDLAKFQTMVKPVENGSPENNKMEDLTTCSQIGATPAQSSTVGNISVQKSNFQQS